MTRPIKAPPQRLRQRQRADGSWRLWWEPSDILLELGFTPVELDAKRLTWSTREAERLNELVDEARSSGGPKKRAAPDRGRTVKATIEAFKKAPKWDTLKPATQRDYLGGFRIIEEVWGSSLVADFTQPIVVEWYETCYRTRGAHQAVSLIRKLSILLAYAKRRGWRADNPCLQMDIVVPAGRSRVATWDELDALTAAARAEGLLSIELAILLSVFQGQRQTDIRKAETSEFRRAAWLFRRSKRGNVGGMKLHPEVMKPLKAMLAAAGDRQQLLHYEVTGRPYTLDQFGDAWGRVRSAAAKARPTVATLQFRDLRRTFGHLARIGGANPRDAGDALGNQAGFDPKLGEIYMPASFETASRAVAAIKRPTKKRTSK